MSDPKTDDEGGAAPPDEAPPLTSGDIGSSTSDEGEERPAADDAAPEGEPPAEPTQEQRAASLVAIADRHHLVPGLDIPIIPGRAEMQDLVALAVTLAAADAVPVALRNKPNDVFLVLLTARDLGVALTTAMREFHVIEGKVTVSPKVKLAMVRERGRREGWRVWPDPNNDHEQATWHGTREDTPGVTWSSTFTIHDARRVSVPKWEGSGQGRRKVGDATLADKDNWENYPQRMLSWRAVGYLMDDAYGEVGTGLYSPDELGAMTDDEGNILDISIADPLEGTKAPRGHGPKPPDPGDQPLAEADPDTYADLRRRIDALTASGDEVKAALLELWTKHDPEAGITALPQFDRLQVRHRLKAKAQVESIEGRMKRAEWGDDVKTTWAKATTTGNGFGPRPETPRDADESDGGDGAPEEPAAAQGVTGPPETPDPAPDPPSLVDQVTAEVTKLSDTGIRQWFRGRGVPISRDDVVAELRQTMIDIRVAEETPDVEPPGSTGATQPTLDVEG